MAYNSLLLVGKFQKTLQEYERQQQKYLKMIMPSGVKVESNKQQRNAHRFQWTKYKLLKNLAQ